MIQRLESLLDEIGALHSKLLLLVGRVGAGNASVLATLASRHGVSVFSVGSEVGRRLAVMPVKQRALAAPMLLRELAGEHSHGGPVLLDNLELLFDRTLQLDPLDLLKQLARAQRVVAVWPGELRDGRLAYADIGHPEHQDYGLEGLVPFVIQ